MHRGNGARPGARCQVEHPPTGGGLGVVAEVPPDREPAAPRERPVRERRVKVVRLDLDGVPERQHPVRQVEPDLLEARHAPEPRVTQDEGAGGGGHDGTLSPRSRGGARDRRSRHGERRDPRGPSRNRMRVFVVYARNIHQLGGRRVPAAHVGPGRHQREAASWHPVHSSPCSSACRASRPAPRPRRPNRSARRATSSNRRGWSSNRSRSRPARTSPSSSARIRRPASRGTSRSWAIRRFSGSSIASIGRRTAPALPIVGAAGGEVLTIRGLAAGTTTLSIGYGQPWVGGTKGEWAYRLSVTVQ